MRYFTILFLTFIVLFFIACENSENEKEEDIVSINEIEETITSNNTSVGCDDDKNVTGCEEKNVAEVILKILEKDSEKEKNEKELKEELISFVDSVNINKRKVLEEYVSEFDNKNIKKVKSKLTELVELEHRVKSKDVKKKLEGLISEISTSKENSKEIKKTLNQLVNTIDEQSNVSSEKFTNALVEDLSQKNMTLIDENDDYFIVKVQEGENLSILAERYYNDNKKYKLIYEANKDKINSKYEIRTGSTLMIPKL